MSEEIKNEEVVAEAQAAPQQSEDAVTNAVFEYVQSIFAIEHVNEYMETLTEKQKSYIIGFKDGICSLIKNVLPIGIYSASYIEKFDLPEKLIETLRVFIRRVQSKEYDVDFVIVLQMKPEEAPAPSVEEAPAAAPEAEVEAECN